MVAAFGIALSIAVANGHNRNLLDPRRVIGEAADYDLLFFHTADFSPPIATAVPQPGLAVSAYGQGVRYELCRASGLVREVTPAPSGPPAYFTFSNAKTGADEAGPGFSGGPMLNAQGRLVGIIFGFKDDAKSRQRLIYAYDMARVRAELSALQKPPAVPLNYSVITIACTGFSVAPFAGTRTRKMLGITPVFSRLFRGT